MSKYFIFIFIILSGCTTSLMVQYQKDADIYRMRHLEKHVSQIEEYFEIAGKYPFEGASEKTIKVSFVTKDQVTGQEMAQSDRVLSISQESYRAEVERVLKRPVRLWFDPQKVSTTAPTYYMYVYDKNYYYFIVHLNRRYSFAGWRAAGFSQIEATNDPIDHEAFWRPVELFKNGAFRAAVDKKPSKNAWFEKLEHENQ